MRLRRALAWAIAVFVYVALPLHGPAGDALAGSPVALMIYFAWAGRR